MSPNDFTKVWLREADEDHLRLLIDRIKEQSIEAAVLIYQFARANPVS